MLTDWWLHLRRVVETYPARVDDRDVDVAVFGAMLFLVGLVEIVRLA